MSPTGSIISRGAIYRVTPGFLVDLWVMRDIERLGWNVIVVWECELALPEKLANRLDMILKQFGRS
jgi:G:T-mismatch repair DNA endonuclease (very short patch repair protein)